MAIMGRQNGFILLVLVAILRNLNSNGAEAQRIRSSFGETCNSTVRCDSKQNLACREGICECIMSDTMIFDSKKESCAVFVGEKCLFTTTTVVEIRKEGEDNGTEVEEKIWNEQLPCVDGASCTISSGYCGCDPVFKETKNGTCEPKLTFGMECNAHSECRQDLHLICNGGKCSCNETYTVFDSSQQQCVGRAGESCEKTGSCPINGKCDQNKKCACNRGYYPSTVEGICKAKPIHGMACQAQFGCLEDKEGLVCRWGVCRCESGKVYHSVMEKCVLSAGSLCVSSSTERNNPKTCAENARCVQEANQIYDYRNGNYYFPHKCRCNSNFYQNLEGNCTKKHGPNEHCYSNDQCRNDNALSLSCISGSCKCSDQNKAFDSWYKVCSCKAGATSCQSCGPNAIYDSSKSHCVCLEGFSTDPDGLCRPSYGSPCANNDALYEPCNANEGLVCVNKKCNCELGELDYFSEGLRRCYTFVKGPCGNGYNNSCTPGSECVQVGQGRHQCKCKPGFLPVDGKCEIAYGLKCDDKNIQVEDSPRCDETGGLNCIRGVCKCGEFQKYDKAELRCRGLVDSACHVNEKDFCVDGAICKALRNFRNVNRGICQCAEGFIMNGDGTCTKQNGTVNVPDALLAGDEMPKDEEYDLARKPIKTFLITLN